MSRPHPPLSGSILVPGRIHHTALPPRAGETPVTGLVMT